MKYLNITVSDELWSYNGGVKHNNICISITMKYLDITISDELWSYNGGIKHNNICISITMKYWNITYLMWKIILNEYMMWYFSWAK